MNSATSETPAAAGAKKPRVLSGITATGKLTIGNYVGAISVWARAQDDYDNFFFVADLHALTIPESINAADLRERITAITALYLACGIDPNKSVIFRQSHVPAHATLGWILGCVTPMSWLERMTQYKTKAEDATPGAGLFTYPALMAADILLYHAEFVPVGDDQRQHIEITRDIALRFNHLFGPTFTLPQALIRSSGARIMGLDDPTSKMSKSLAQTRAGHAIGLLDDPKQIRTAVMRAVTDSGSEVRSDALSPGMNNLLTLYEVLTDTSRTQTLRLFEGQRYGKVKTAVADAAIERVQPIQDRYHEIRRDASFLDATLAQGAARAASVADATLDVALRNLGLR